jgi:hypothetical protein
MRLKDRLWWTLADRPLVGYLVPERHIDPLPGYVYRPPAQYAYVLYDLRAKSYLARSFDPSNPRLVWTIRPDHAYKFVAERLAHAVAEDFGGRFEIQKLQLP